MASRQKNGTMKNLLPIGLNSPKFSPSLTPPQSSLAPRDVGGGGTRKVENRRDVSIPKTAPKSLPSFRPRATRIAPSSQLPLNTGQSDLSSSPNYCKSTNRQFPIFCSLLVSRFVVLGCALVIFLRHFPPLYGWARSLSVWVAVRSPGGEKAHGEANLAFANTSGFPIFGPPPCENEHRATKMKGGLPFPLFCPGGDSPRLRLRRCKMGHILGGPYPKRTQRAGGRREVPKFD